MRGSRARYSFFATLFALVTAAAVAVPALAHLERPSYWPDPRPDRSVKPPAGGKVPEARSLASAVTGAGPGEVRVVCKGENGAQSLRLAQRSIRSARTKGFHLRPSQPKIRYTAKRAKRMLRINRALAKMCRFHSIQAAVNASGNNDRVVIMPGRYTEPRSRKAPTNDPKCTPSLLQQDSSGALAPSYEYQATCPNDQNLVYVQGRAVKGKPLPVPRSDRHGIPKQELGRCVRCNLQMEGSGPKPEDVIIDAGFGYKNPKRPEAKPSGYAKHVVLRTDRSDGFVGRNFLMRGALEHAFYTEETDGVLLDKTKFYWAADYGHLSFTTDHNVVQNCEGMGAGDSVVYPGAAPETGEQVREDFYGKSRINTVIRKCDLRGSTLGYSGSMGNAVRLTRNHIYGNAAGISSDTLSAPGHPGYPADSMVIDRNYIYSNNLNLYRPNPPVEPLVPMPIGTGIVWPGMNNGRVHHNWIFDNWRHGTVLMAVPDLVAGQPEGDINPGASCEGTITYLLAMTSCGNRYHHNRMGQVPPNFKWPKKVKKFGNVTGPRKAKALPNGVDFWWDEFLGNTGNCWYKNTGWDGTSATITGSGAGLPPDPLPPDCSPLLSIGTSDLIKEAVLLDCSMWSRGETSADRPLCYWFDMPPRPHTPAARREERAWLESARKWARSEEAQELKERLDEAGKTPEAFANRP